MADTQSVRSELELRDYLGVLRRRKWSIVVVMVIVVGAAVGFTLVQTKVYEAKATLVIETSLASQVLIPTAAVEAAVTDAQVQTEAELMQAFPTTRAITKQLGYLPDVDIETVEGTPAVFVTSRDPLPEKAAKEVNDFTNTYVEVRNESLANTVRNAMEDLQAQIKNLDAEIAADRDRIIAIEMELNAGVDAEAEGVLRAEQARLQALVSPEQVLARQGDLQRKLDGLGTKLALTGSGDNFTVSGSATPKVPVEPRPLRTGLIALGVGLLLGLIVAFLRDYFDDTLRTKEDLDHASGGVPVLALIPSVPNWRDRSKPVLESVAHPHSAVSEAYRTLRTSLAFAAIGHRVRIIQVTSSTSGEGKTTTAANLAVTLARTGKRVVLVDCDLRRPRVHEFFGLDNKIGFASVLIGEINVVEALHPIPGVIGLNVLPAGPPPPNPSELLSAKAARQLLDTMAEVADFVVVDSPPLLPVADSVTLAGYADATVLLVTARATTRRSLHRSLELLQQVDAPLEGILFNRVGREATYGYGYGYSFTDDAAPGPPIPDEDLDVPPDTAGDPQPSTAGDPQPSTAGDPQPSTAGDPHPSI
jgi:succinoglycan biosynthesis transport protein ExoP